MGNYLVNNVAAGLAAGLVPPTAGSSSLLTPQYLTFCAFAAILLGLCTWWYLTRLSRAGTLMQALIFGIVGFVLSIAAAFITGAATVLIQTGSFAQLMAVLPNFVTYLVQMTTAVLAGLWIVPALVVGFIMGKRMGSPAASPAMPRPMI